MNVWLVVRRLIIGVGDFHSSQTGPRGGGGVSNPLIKKGTEGRELTERGQKPGTRTADQRPAGAPIKIFAQAEPTPVSACLNLPAAAWRGSMGGLERHVLPY